MKIAPSILSADFAELKKEVKKVEQGGAKWIHVDTMDGHFVPNLTFGANVVKALRPHTDLLMDCHLMVEKPEEYIDSFYEAGADLVTIHAESTVHVHRALQMIKNKGIKAGIALNPATPVSQVQAVLPMVDLVLVMTVNPGFGGQAFIPETLDKIRQLDMLKKNEKLDYEIEVDGGINPETAAACAEAGATVMVAGSYIYNAENAASQIDSLQKAVNKG
ncbi:Ribulose-phosphate 3-epimerase [Alkalibacterium sp. AK22]|uniref:ribulose-phosphate 3-epimerase n=1 Tax=Alkalibacterium sp. AK22 TaxID=1229520 RepID=UPI0004496E64|nr:ribulose-phosphate 3-epimerase [Alkalibacterium sp. AK22]EXJ24224.1 Ribulose-phosphate 3-epimerase [Alkalibacterium sp. AK22]